MKYLVIEIQKFEDGNIANIVTVKDTRAEAESTYHSILASAAISALPLHGAMLMDERAMLIMRDCYDRQVVEPVFPDEEIE